jgi:putative NADH-flavin reductase
VVRASALDWTIVRPGVLTNGPKRGRYRYGARVGHWLWTVRISRADVAAFMLDQLTDRRYVRATIGLAD